MIAQYQRNGGSSPRQEHGTPAKLPHSRAQRSPRLALLPERADMGVNWQRPRRDTGRCPGVVSLVRTGELAAGSSPRLAAPSRKALPWSEWNCMPENATGRLSSRCAASLTWQRLQVSQLR